LSVVRVERQRRHDRSEDLLLNDGEVGLDVNEDGRLDEVAYRSELGGGIESWPDLDLACSVRDSLGELLEDGVLDARRVPANAALSVVEQPRVERTLHRGIEIRIGEHDVELTIELDLASGRLWVVDLSRGCASSRGCCGWADVGC